MTFNTVTSAFEMPLDFAKLQNYYHSGQKLQNWLEMLVAVSRLAVQEYERAVIFRLGRLLSGGAKAVQHSLYCPHWECPPACSGNSLRCLAINHHLDSLILPIVTITSGS